MGYRKLSARPRHHARRRAPSRLLKKSGRRHWRRSRSRHGTDPGDIEVWFGDEARVGQKNKITRRWARRGSRPSAPSDQRTSLDLHLRRHLPQAGQGRRPDPALVQHRDDEPASRGDLGRCRPWPPCGAACSTRPAGISRPSSMVPDNITIVPLPPKCPELNPQENVWQFIRDNWLSNRVFDDADDAARSLLRRLEQARGSAVDHHVHRHPRLGTSVLISESWY